MSAQPDHTPITPYAPAPGAPAELLTQLRADQRTWPQRRSFASSVAQLRHFQQSATGRAPA